MRVCIFPTLLLETFFVYEFYSLSPITGFLPAGYIGTILYNIKKLGVFYFIFLSEYLTSLLFFFPATNGFFLYVSLFRYHFADNLIFYGHFGYLFLLGFLVPAYVFVVLYLLLFVAQINDRFYCQKKRVIATLFRGCRHVTRNGHLCIIYSIFKKTIGCHALILLNWQYRGK
jgi:hypothetical protein